jgi:Transposase DDE domain group 1
VIKMRCSGRSSDSTAFRVVDEIASSPGLLDALAAAHARARAQVWKLTGAPERVTVDIDATLLTSHSEKQGVAGTFKGAYGFHPMLAYCDETSEARAAILRPANADSNTAADQIAVVEQALQQVPFDQIEDIEILVRADRAGATHDLLAFCREHRLRFSLGYELTDQVRAAIFNGPENAWVSALATDASPRKNGQIAEITEDVDLATCPLDRGCSSRVSARIPAHSCLSPTTTAIASKQRSPISPTLTSSCSSVASASVHTPRTTSATARTPACATCRSETSSTTASGLRSRPSRTT